MDERDLELRILTYRLFVEQGRAPTADEVGRAAGLRVGDVQAGWRRLHEAHALVLNPATIEIRMANPFSAVPTAHRVHSNARWWYANCAWDAFGICAALHADGRIETSCPDCGHAIAIEVRDQRPLEGGFFFHCLVPATHWWDDIIFTRSVMNLFQSEEHIEQWLGGRSPGATISAAKLSELAHAWWSDRLSTTWQPHTRDQNQQILNRLGLTGDFWCLP